MELQISDITSLDPPYSLSIVGLTPGRNVVHVQNVKKSFPERGFKDCNGDIYAEGEGFFFVAEGFESEPFSTIGEVCSALDAKLEELSLA